MTYLAVAIGLRVLIAFLAIRIAISAIINDGYLGSMADLAFWVLLFGQLMFQMARYMAGERSRWRNLLFLR